MHRNVARGSSCAAVVSFSPTNTGTFNASLTGSYYTGVSTVNFSAPITGVGIIGITINTPSANFGTLPIGQTSNQTLTFTNTGTQTATSFTINAAAMASGYSLVSTTCGSSLAGAASCSAVVQFAPNSPGAVNSALPVGYNTGLGTTTLSCPLSGTGSISITINSPSAAFGTLPMGQNEDLTLTFTNSGTRTATSFQINNSSIAAPYSVISSTCGSSLSGGASCNVAVAFAPVAPGTFNATHGSYNTGFGTVNLSASITGTSIVSIVLNSPSIAFGTVLINQTQNLTLTFTNSGLRTAQSFTINQGSLTAPYSVSSTNCGSTLAGGASCNVVVQFAPTAPGTFNETLTGSYDSGAGIVNISGSVTGSSIISITLNSPSIDFGTVPMQQTQNLTLTFTNSGLQTAQSFTINQNSISAPYSIASSTCSNTLAGGRKLQCRHACSPRRQALSTPHWPAVIIAAPV